MTKQPKDPIAEAKRTVLVVAAVAGAVAAWQLYRGHVTKGEVWGIAAALLIIARFIPVAALAFHNGWMKLAGVLGYINSRILLTLTFFAVLMPIGTAMRLCGYDPLDRRGPRRSSYWVAKNNGPFDRKRFEQSF